MGRSGYRGRCVYIDNSELTTIKSEILESLACGDFIIKRTGNAEHRYFVSYKEEHVGICFTYVAAGLVETVSYDWNGTTKKWEYNSTDKWEQA